MQGEIVDGTAALDAVADLLAAAEAEGLGLCTGDLEGYYRARGHRGLMAMVKTAVVLLVHPGSRVPTGETLLRRTGGWVADLAALQGDDGLFSSGDNLVSPPDSAFTITDVAITVQVLRGECPPSLVDVQSRLLEILRRAAPALLAGGVHTPNHRWELAGALARTGAVLADDALLHRARAWLAEGPDIDSDGLYSERSPIYAAHVSNPSLTALGDVLGLDDLHQVVHRNLHAQLDLTDSRGSVETVQSRRQDQKSTFGLGPFLGQLRRAAIVHACAVCADGAGRAAAGEGVDAVGVLAEQLLDPALGGPLPPTHGPAGSRRRMFGGARLLKDVRAGDVRAGDVPLEVTVYGGSDVPAVGRVASGLACNPTFLKLRLGDLGASVRLSREFFGLGPFRAERMELQGDRVRLEETVDAAYYQPLPAEACRTDGRYDLEHEGRFAAAMSFSARSRDVVTLSTTVMLDVRDDGVDLAVTTAGPATGHALEIAFEERGTLVGGVPVGGGRFHLVDGGATYSCGGETLHVGPGLGAGAERPPVYLPGEAYTFLGGTDAAGGTRLYLTWSSPGTVRLRLSRLPPASY